MWTYRGTACDVWGQNLLINLIQAFKKEKTEYDLLLFTKRSARQVTIGNDKNQWSYLNVIKCITFQLIFFNSFSKASLPDKPCTTLEPLEPVFHSPPMHGSVQEVPRQHSLLLPDLQWQYWSEFMCSCLNQYCKAEQCLPALQKGTLTDLPVLPLNCGEW